MLRILTWSSSGATRSSVRLRRDRSGAKDGPDAQTAPTQTGSVSRTARSAPIDTRSILVMCTVPLPVGRATPKLPSIRRAGRARAPATAANVSLCFRRSRCPVHAGGPTASAHTLDDVQYCGLPAISEQSGKTSSRHNQHARPCARRPAPQQHFPACGSPVHGAAAALLEWRSNADLACAPQWRHALRLAARRSLVGSLRGAVAPR